MAKFRKKPVVIEAITFEDLVAHGLAQEGANIVGGVPWAFTYAGHAVTHETDDLYLVPALEGTMRFARGDVLITGVKGEIYPCKVDIFAATYEPAVEADQVTLKTPDDPMLQFFGYKHLPPAMQEVSRPFCEVATRIVETLPRNPERTVALRKLLEAKDCAVRSTIFKAGP